MREDKEEMTALEPEIEEREVWVPLNDGVKLVWERIKKTVEVTYSYPGDIGLPTSDSSLGYATKEEALAEFRRRARATIKRLQEAKALYAKQVDRCERDIADLERLLDRVAE